VRYLPFCHGARAIRGGLSCCNARDELILCSLLRGLVFFLSLRLASRCLLSLGLRPSLIALPLVLAAFPAAAHLLRTPNPSARTKVKTPNPTLIFPAFCLWGGNPKPVSCRLKSHKQQRRFKSHRVVKTGPNDLPFRRNKQLQKDPFKNPTSTKQFPCERPERKLHLESGLNQRDGANEAMAGMPLFAHRVGREKKTPPPLFMPLELIKFCGSKT
jgi:hypothetical protein